MAVAGNPKDDKKWWFTDKTGFQFDTKPRNVAYGRDGENLGSDEKYYGAGYIELPWNNPEKCSFFDPTENKTTQYNGWLNWVNKFQPDVRFAAISDKNAYLNQFPEVLTPWKFTEYIFQGINSGYSVIEPPLYSPKTLKVINHVKNPDGFVTGNNEHRRRAGKLKGNGYDSENYEYGYYYVCKYNSSSTEENIRKGIASYGPKRKQFASTDEEREKYGDLETGLIIKGVRYPPWYDPEAYPKYNSSFVKTDEICSVRIKYRYKSNNRGYIFDNKKGEYVESGIRLYRKDFAAKCVDIGQHGNVPANTINMIAPKSWFDPTRSYRNVVVPIVTYEVGEAMYANDDGILHTSSLGNNPDIKIEGFTETNTTTTEVINGCNLKHIMITGNGQLKEQPHPKLGSKFGRFTKATLATGVSNGDFIHRGCPFFVGNATTGCYCTVKRQLMENGDVTEVSDSSSIMDMRLGLEGMIKESILYCTSHSGDDGTKPIGTKCSKYVENGPKEIVVFDANQITSEQYNKMLGYDRQSFVNLDPMSSFGNKFSIANGLLPKTLMPSGTVTTGLTGLTARRKVTYEFQQIGSTGRQTASERAGQASMAADYTYVVPGTGIFALDKVETGYGGVDTNIFSGSNLMSRHRFNQNVLGCYEPDKCNNACGQIQCIGGSVEGIFANVETESSDSSTQNDGYCRYYSSGACPSLGINQRAFEFDREYKNLINNVLIKFRESGIDGFGLKEYKIQDGVYAACGVIDLNIMHIDVRNGSGSVYFFYNKSRKDVQNHKKSNVYAFVRQYGKGSTSGKLSRNSYLRMKCDVPVECIDVDSNQTLNFFDSSWDNNLPWLVELYDDYVSPISYESYTTNLMPFIGGRMPEYKDYSKMGSEVLIPMTTTELGYDGLLSGGKGGDDEFKDSQESKSYMGYWVDKTGEYIIESLDSSSDGISIGEQHTKDESDIRANLPPSQHKGAKPIFGIFTNTSMNADKTTKAKMRAAWVYSSDTRELINQINETGISVSDDESGESSMIKVAAFSTNCLPKERKFYYCPRCCPKPYGYMSYNRNNIGEQKTYLNCDDSDSYQSDSTLNAYGEPLFYQIFTDWEAQHYENRCPRCASIGINTALVDGGEWKFFPKCRAEGVVNYFGLPGEVIDNSGFFWKNHTEITRSFISEILGKLGKVNESGGGYVMGKGSSADSDLESNVFRIRQYGTNIVNGYKHDDDIENRTLVGGEEAAYTNTDTRIPEGNGDNYRHLANKTQLGLDYGGDKGSLQLYDDRYANPYRLLDKTGKIASGLDFISAPLFVSMRNLVEPIMGYPCYNVPITDEFITIKQKGHKQRFTEVTKDIEDGLIGIDSFILADNDGHSENNYVQYYDEDAGKALRAYYPTSPIWWYRHDCCGIIYRSGGDDALHFNASGSSSGGGETAYVGNVRSGCYNFLHGWLPLDKEVVGATLTFSISGYPEEPPLGRTRQGGKIFTKHWHPYVPELKPCANASTPAERRAIHDAEDKQMLNDIMGWSDDVDAEETTNNAAFDPNDYTPMLYNRRVFSNEDELNISIYYCDNFGVDINQNYITWSGYGEDIIQTVTEDSIWKELTFEEYANEMNSFLMDIEIQVGGSEDKHKVIDTITTCPPEIASGFAQNFGQAITGLFNYTNLNSSHIINKFGMEFAEKNVDSSWASGGQVIEQSDNIFANTTSGSGQGTSARTSGVNTLNRSNTSLGGDIVVDITDLVKDYYNDRILRGFEATGGLKYEEVWNFIKSNKVDLIKTINEDKPDQRLNARYKLSEIDGYLLTDSYRYPKLEEGEFPTIESGGEYETSPMDIVDLEQCGSYYIPIDYPESDSESKVVYDENNPAYYNNSPYVLFHTSAVEENYGVPVSGHYVTDDKTKVKFVQGSPENSCILWSPWENEMFFTVNISGFPTQVEKRPYRSQKGGWNTANAICPNPTCFVHQDNKTVSEADVLSKSWVNQYKLHSFLPTSTKCGACRADLTKDGTGAIYTGGDGIMTYSYIHMPQKDSIINGFVIDINQRQGVNENCSFSVMSKASDEAFWTILFHVDWLPNARKWRCGKYGKDGKLSYSNYDTLPVFKGNWCDGYVFDSNKMNGYHFMARKANQIKFVAQPNTKQENGELIGNNGLSTRIFGPFELDKNNLTTYSFNLQKRLNIPDIEKECKFEISKTSNFGSKDIIFSTGILTYNSSNKTITFAENINLDDLQEYNTLYYRIVVNRYSCNIRKFQVYGFEIGDYLKITDNVSGNLIPLSNNTVSVNYSANISKILRIDAIYGDTVLYRLEDKVPLNCNYNDLFYTAEFDNSSRLYKITGGEFFYDTLQHIIYLPYQIKTNNGIVDGSIFDSSLVDQTTLPKAINVYTITGSGSSVDLPITSIGGGPSYTIEKDCITEIYGYDPLNADSDKDFNNIYGKDIKQYTTLPKMGESIYFRKQGGRYKMNWKVSNKKRLVYKYSGEWDDLRGTELCDAYREGGAGTDKDAFEKFLGGGGDETKNGLSTDIEEQKNKSDNVKTVSRRLGGKVSGEITLTGLPNTIIGGVLYVYAPKTKTRSVNIGGNAVTTYERTGGMRRTGFPFTPTKAMLKNDGIEKYINCVSLTKPKIVVYLRERLLTEKIE